MLHLNSPEYYYFFDLELNLVKEHYHIGPALTIWEILVYLCWQKRDDEGVLLLKSVGFYVETFAIYLGNLDELTWNIPILRTFKGSKSNNWFCF